MLFIFRRAFSPHLPSLWLCATNSINIMSGNIKAICRSIKSTRKNLLPALKSELKPGLREESENSLKISHQGWFLDIMGYIPLHSRNKKIKNTNVTILVHTYFCVKCRYEYKRSKFIGIQVTIRLGGVQGGKILKLCINKIKHLFLAHVVSPLSFFLQYSESFWSCTNFNCWPSSPIRIFSNSPTSKSWIIQLMCSKQRLFKNELFLHPRECWGQGRHTLHSIPASSHKRLYNQHWLLIFFSLSLSPSCKQD